MHATKVTLSLVALGLGTALASAGAFAQDYKSQDRSANKDYMMQAQQRDQDQQAASSRMRQKQATTSTRRRTMAASETSEAPKTTVMGEAATEGPKYRVGRSPNDNGIVNVEAQKEAQATTGPSSGGRFYNYSPGYRSESGPGFGPPAQRMAQNDVAMCQMRFRSFDPASGTFLGFDGIRHPCP